MPSDLGAVVPFSVLPSAALAQLARHAEILRVEKGQTLFRDGQPAASVWCIQRGWVHLVKRVHRHSRPVTVFTMTRDELFCGISAFDRSAYTADAVTATPCTVIRIDAPAFGSALASSAEFACAILRICCDRIRHMARGYCLAYESVERRVAHVLLRLREEFGATLPVTHREIAQTAGTTVETCIRVVGAWKKKGWLRGRRAQLSILKPEQLTAMVRNGV